MQRHSASEIERDGYQRKMIIEVALLLGLLVLYNYWKFRERCRHWSSKGVREPEKNWFPLGNCVITCPDTIFKRRNISDTIRLNYEKYRDEKFLGMYGPMGTPLLMVHDLDMAKNILIKDFDHFVDRSANFDIFGAKSTNLTDQLWNNCLAVLKGEKWKTMRAKVSPFFTSSKLRMMMPLMEKVAKDMCSEMKSASGSDSSIDMKAMCSRVSLDTIASCVYGIDAGTMGQNHSEFIQVVENILARDIRDTAMFASSMIPGVSHLLAHFNVPFFKPKETLFMWDIVTKTMEMKRNNPGPKRNDLIDMMLEAMQSEDNNNNDEKSKTGGVDQVQAVAIALIMLVAGYETTATTLAFVTYELAMNPDIQERLQKDIDRACEDTDEDQLPPYQSIQDVTYLDAILNETMRRYSPFGLVPRGCIKDYKVPGTDLIIEKGTDIEIPVSGIHMNPDFYPNPEVFDPEHFSKEAVARRHPMAFLGFGQGPRNCIGIRLFMLLAKICLVTVLRKYVLIPCEETPKTIPLDPRTILSIPRDPIPLKVKPRM